jgi:hypothetical protein
MVFSLPYRAFSLYRRCQKHAENYILRDTVIKDFRVTLRYLQVEPRTEVDKSLRGIGPHTFASIFFYL